MYTYNNYIYDEENLAFVPVEIYSPENMKIIEKYTTNKGEYKKIEMLLKQRKAQQYKII